MYRKKVKPWYPKGIRSSREKQAYEKLKLRPVGEWSKDLVANNKTLQEKHWEFVTKVLAEAPEPKNKKEAEFIIKRAVLSPVQRLVILYEVSSRRPLSPEEFEEYLRLFRSVVGEKQYRSLFGGKSPAQMRKIDEAKLRKIYGGKTAAVIAH
jgi:hypothetical protein